MTRTQALVLAGHGSQQHPGASAVVSAHADRIRATGPFDEVRTAFWKQEPALHDVARHISSDLAYVVPVLTSAGYFATQVFPRELGVDRDRAAPAIRYTDPIGTHDRVTTVLASRVDTARVGPADSVGVAIVGHGTDRNPSSGQATRRHATRLDDNERYAGVTAVFLDQDPAVETLFDRLDADELVVVPFFVADGHHTRTDIPAEIGHPGVGESTRVEGRLVHYTGAVGTDPSIAAVAVERALEAGARPGTDAGDLPSAERSFIDWVERVPAGRVWGELHLSHDGAGYELRHRADVDRRADTLTRIDGTSELRTHVRHDESGRYRPLSGHRSLPTGWRHAVADGPTFVRSVRAVYPGAIASWAAEHAGNLTVTPFGETAARQGGRFTALDSADRATVERTTRAVCGSCVRTRRWEYAARSTDDATSEGDIPCPEACPVFLSAVADACRDRDEQETRTTPPRPSRDAATMESIGGVH